MKTLEQYDKLSYPKAMAYLKSLSIEDRNLFQQKLYERICAAELAVAPMNVDTTCKICGTYIEWDMKRYEKIGNCCNDCEDDLNRLMAEKFKLYQSHRGAKANAS